MRRHTSRKNMLTGSPEGVCEGWCFFSAGGSTIAGATGFAGGGIALT